MGNEKERMEVFKCLNELKPVSMVNNIYLDKLIQGLPNVVYGNDTTYTCFEHNGQWYFMDIGSDTTIPSNSIIVFQHTITKPEAPAKFKRIASRKVELTFAYPYVTR